MTPAARTQAAWSGRRYLKRLSNHALEVSTQPESMCHGLAHRDTEKVPCPKWNHRPIFYFLRHLCSLEVEYRDLF